MCHDIKEIKTKATEIEAITNDRGGSQSGSIAGVHNIQPEYQWELVGVS